MTQEACAFLPSTPTAPPSLVPFGAAFLGAALAFLLQAARGRWANGVTARRLALALWEELSAVEFDGPPATRFDGFSSQVFDSLFADLARCLPEDLLRAVVRYHWKMKFIQERVSARLTALGPAAGMHAWTNVAAHVPLAWEQWEALRPRLAAYGNRWPIRLFVMRRERLLGPG